VRISPLGGGGAARPPLAVVLMKSDLLHSEFSARSARQNTVPRDTVTCLAACYDACCSDEVGSGLAQARASSSARRMTRSMRSVEGCTILAVSFFGVAAEISNNWSFSNTCFIARSGLRRNSVPRIRAGFSLFAHSSRKSFQRGKAVGSSLVVSEVHHARISRLIRFIPGLVNKNFLGRSVPSGFKPNGSFLGWLGRTTENRALHLENESFVALISGLCFPGLAIR
jgi:hypothetical protein